MHHPGGVRGVDSGRELARNRGNFFRSQPSPFREDRRQRLALQ